VKQRTIGRTVSFRGVGLHRGQETVMQLHPAEAGEGLWFVRGDLEGRPRIKVCPENVVTDRASQRHTTLCSGPAQVETIEHVLAAVSGLGIDNLIVELDGSEAPEPIDGSSAPFVQLIEEAGIVELAAPQDPFIVRRPVCYSQDGVEIIATPYDGLKLSFTIQFENPILGTQHMSLDITPESFKAGIASARTFVLYRDVERLREMGLIRGGTLQNAVVVKDDGIMNAEPLRYPDEPVRHKILDLLGDLSVVGRPVRGHIHAIRSGHHHNAAFVQMLVKAHAGPAEYERLLREVHFDIHDITRIMPHRYPFLLVDRILYLKERERVVGLKNVTVNEPFFMGHFPGHPIMPAVLIIEAMAQVGGVLLLNTVDDPESKLVYFMGIDNAKFRRPVVPGDQILFDLELQKLKRRTCKMAGKAFVQGQMVAEADLLSSIVDRREAPRR
jgi:UDP-3-O-[3-hydroxymyristoyl] N-acetylglucosamine deacetylase / 3-hydroxyacyl-[acyl-carrier-protein] dehydratase